METVQPNSHAQTCGRLREVDRGLRDCFIEETSQLAALERCRRHLVCEAQRTRKSGLIHDQLPRLKIFKLAECFAAPICDAGKDGDFLTCQLGLKHQKMQQAAECLRRRRLLACAETRLKVPW